MGLVEMKSDPVVFWLKNIKKGLRHDHYYQRATAMLANISGRDDIDDIDGGEIRDWRLSLWHRWKQSRWYISTALGYGI